MITYSECLTLILMDGRVIVCQDNGYTCRTLESSFGSSYTDKDLNNYGFIYWKKQAMKSLQFNLEDIVMQAKGRVAFTN